MSTNKYVKYSRSENHSTPADDEIDLGQLAGVLWYHKWRIAGITALCTALGIAYALTATPIYQANAMVEFASNKNQVLGDLSDIVGTQKTPADSEVDMIKSRRVLGKTVEDLQLNWVAQPVIARWTRVFSRNDEQRIRPHISIEQFDLPEESFDIPLTLTVITPTEYTLTLPDKTVLNGKVGETLDLGNSGKLKIGGILAVPEQKFILIRQALLTSIEQLNSNLAVAPKNKNSPMIGLSLNGTDPIKLKQILNSILNNYAAENRDKDVQFASSGLKFIDDELPRLRAALQEAENNLNAYRSRNNSLDVPLEAKGILESLNKIEMQLVDLRAEEAVLKEVYTQDHPALRALYDKIRVLASSRERLNAQISRMPSVQQDIIRLTRNVEINQGIYVQLLNKQQELNILKASSQGNVRIIDEAVTPKRPIKPKKAIIVLLATALGLFMGMGYYLLKSLLNRGIHSEDEIEALGLDVIVSIPLSDMQNRRDRLLKRLGKTKKHVRSNSMLALKDPSDLAVEALRALRTNLFFSTMNTSNKVIMISGATPEVGKSFVAANLAVLMAQTNKKVLLIDGDMRKGYMHHLLEMPSSEGFAEILAGDDHYLNNIWKTNLAGLHFVSGGNTPKSPAELLLGNRLEKFLAWADAHYDYVILDTPPILAVTDAAVMGQYAGITLLVSRFGRTSVRELDACVSRFEAGNVRINGIVLNGVERTASNYYSYLDYGDRYGKYGRYGKDGKESSEKSKPKES